MTPWRLLLLLHLMVRIFREVGCYRMAWGLGSTSWWDQDTGVDPTQPKLNPSPDLNPDPKRARNGPETWLRRFGIERENSPTILNADHDS